jgi:phage terminase large subunit-like protein
MVSSAQRLTGWGINIVEFNQSAGNLTEASNNLYELIKGHNLRVYPDDDMRLAVLRAVATETPRGWKISKAVQSHKIDVVVALGMAALGAVGAASRRAPMRVDQGFIEATARMRSRPHYADINAFSRDWRGRSGW